MQRKPKKNQSPQARPRRRASQTFLIKYQLARNPLKAEEEDLKLALKASLEQSKLNGIHEGPITTPPLLTPPPILSTTKSKTTASKTKSNHKSKTPSNKSRQSVAKTKSTTANGVNLSVSKKHAQNSKYAYNSNINTNHLQYTAQYSPYFPILKKEAPDEEYLKKYRPDTHDFLSFICYRTKPAQNHNNDNNSDELAHSSMNDDNNNNHHNLNNNDSNDITTSLSIETHSNGDNNNNNSNSGVRRPIRQSPRLATRHSNKITGNGRTNRKISDHANDNNNNSTTNTNGTNYEENLELASNALDLMAMESSLATRANHDDAQPNHNSRETISKTSSTTSNLKSSNRQYYVKGLMTKEFTGGFAKVRDCQTNKNIVQLI